MLDPVEFVRELLALPAYHRGMQARTPRAPYRQVSYGTHPRQYAMLAEQADPYAPTAVWIHGGGWHFGRPELLLAFGDFFHAWGYRVWLPSHRRVPAVPGAAVLADVVEGLHYLQRTSPTPPQVLLGGMSSGGHLATLAALRAAEWARSGTAVRGLLSCGAPLSLKHLGPSPLRRRLAGALGSAGFGRLDPLTVLSERTDPPDFPALVLHGTRDGMVPWTCGLAFVARGKLVGWEDLRWVALPGGRHLDAVGWVW